MVEGGGSTAWRRYLMLVQFAWYNFIETGSIDRPDTPVRVKISIEDARDMNYPCNNQLCDDGDGNGGVSLWSSSVFFN